MSFFLNILGTCQCIILLWFWNTLTIPGIVLLLVLVYALITQCETQVRDDEKAIFRNKQNNQDSSNSGQVNPNNTLTQVVKFKNRTKSDRRKPKKERTISPDDERTSSDNQFYLIKEDLNNRLTSKSVAQCNNKLKRKHKSTVGKGCDRRRISKKNLLKTETASTWSDVKHRNVKDKCLKREKEIVPENDIEPDTKIVSDFDNERHEDDVDEVLVSSIKNIKLVTKESLRGLNSKQENTDGSANEEVNDVSPDPSHSKMASKNISRLIQESQDALEAGDLNGSKQKALQAITGINIEKDKFLSNRQSDISEQQLGDWYGGCSFVMNKIGEYTNAVKCFYTATIFDSTWNEHNHKSVFNVLWNSLVFSKDPDTLSRKYKDIRRLLIEIDDLAKLAESRGKWNVCKAADGDVNHIFSFLMRQGLVENELIKQPGRKASLWRSARCFLRLGMQEDTRRLCSTILQHACDYDDPEAFEIWAYSLCATKDFDIALEKCELALTFCKDESYKQRLEAFKADIQKQIAVNTSPAAHNGEVKADV